MSASAATDVQVYRQLLRRRVMVAEEKNLLPLVDRGFHRLGHGCHLGMDSHCLRSSLMDLS